MSRAGSSKRRCVEQGCPQCRVFRHLQPPTLRAARQRLTASNTCVKELRSLIISTLAWLIRSLLQEASVEHLLGDFCCRRGLTFTSRERYLAFVVSGRLRVGPQPLQHPSRDFEKKARLPAQTHFEYTNHTHAF
jgi:hypothetical protein